MSLDRIDKLFKEILQDKCNGDCFGCLVIDECLDIKPKEPKGMDL